MSAKVFTLEALEAAFGDSLLLHYGSPADPRLIVIDGGPKGVFKRSLGPRLKSIHEARGGGVLPIRLLMVSHIDDDHIAGLLDFTKMLRAAQDNGTTVPYDVLTLWHNSFDDIVSRAGPTVAAALTGLAPKRKSGAGSAIVASVAQGRQLRMDADALALNMNSGFDDMIQFDASDVKALKIGSGLTFIVLGPRKAELDALEAKWDKEVKALIAKKAKGGRGRRGGTSGTGGSAGRGDGQLSAADHEALAAAFVDDSVHNLSSVVVLAEFGGKRMLLTGDARGDFIIESLRDAKLLKNGKIDVDILKVPHHGSEHNADVPLFKAVVADHYVFSADGTHGNPDPPTFDLLFKARPTGKYHLWLTNDVKKAVAHVKKKKPKNVVLHVRGKNDPSVRVELGAPIAW